MAEIKSMSKQDLVAYMRATREIYKFDSELPSWQRAFQLYKAEGNSADMDCTSCRKRVLEWLEK